MAYTALEKMRKENQEQFFRLPWAGASKEKRKRVEQERRQCGPAEPEKHYEKDSADLKSAALRFLHDRCEGLKFDPTKEQEEKNNSSRLGRSMKKGQIPYNMEMDVNRLCLERELERFIDSGVAEDAYTVYFCYLEMFFGEYCDSKKRVELLSEFEANGSSLLMKHRDHYSHTVYVFALGLAIYETNEGFRKAFKEYYKFDPDESNKEADHRAANFFLEFWGLTALFHDIGYPFEIPFEQVCSYYEVDNAEYKKDREKIPVYLAYKGKEDLTKISDAVKKRLQTIYKKAFTDTDELFAWDIFQKLGADYPTLSENELRGKITNKPDHPELYRKHMDHAWFSANLLFQRLSEITCPKTGKTNYVLESAHIDALTAILLHNSLFKFSIAFYKKKDEAGNPQDKGAPLSMERHPLAYLLMLCDELQCWDRASYGRNTRQEAHPFDADFDFSDNRIRATYLYDTDEWEKIDEYKDKYIKHLQKPTGPKPPELKTFSTMYEEEQSFRTDIENIVRLEKDGLTVNIKMAPVDRSVKHTYLSVSNFLHLYDFAVALNARYRYEGKEDDVTPEKLRDEFEELSLEYKLSNINQAKSFGKYLNAIGCFYTDRPVSYRMLDRFTEEQTRVFAPMEHKRWVLEHQWMGWKEGDYYEREEVLKKAGIDTSNETRRKEGVRLLREQLRIHKLAMDGNIADGDIQKHYDSLSDADKGKDWKPFNSMLKLIKKYDGLRIYQLD